MRHWLVIFFTILSSCSIYAQQLPLFNHYFFKPMVYNPAYTGADSSTNILLVNRTQWTGFKGGPQYNNITVDGNMFNKNTGVGVNIISFRRGLTNTIGGNLFYSYKLKINKSAHVSLGLSAGAINQTLNYSKAITEVNNDPLLFYTNQNNTVFDANAGLAIVIKNLDIGFSVPQLTSSKIAYKTTSDTRTYYTQVQHLLGSLKYKINLSKKKNLSLTPSMILRRAKNAPIQYDINTILGIDNKFWAGLTYKNDYSVSVNAGVVLFKNLTVGYSYEYITGSVSKYAGLSHEIILNIRFNKKSNSDESSKKAKEDEEDKLLKEMASKDLNKILIERLLKKIEYVLDKPNTTSQEIQDLLEEISSFLDDNSSDQEMQAVLKKYYNSVKQSSGELNVLLKGKVTFEDNPEFPNYSKINITITDLGTKQVVATCKPTMKDGKYYIILKPGRKYSLEADCPGYKEIIRNFSPDGSIESYEMSQEIQFKK